MRKSHVMVMWPQSGENFDRLEHKDRITRSETFDHPTTGYRQVNLSIRVCAVEESSLFTLLSWNHDQVREASDPQGWGDFSWGGGGEKTKKGEY